MTTRSRRERFLPPRRQQLVTRLMQLILAALVVQGFHAGAPKTITNAGFGLAVTFLPAVFRRNYQLTLDPWLALWITGAVFLHTLGSAGMYSRLEWWDHVTHSLSASLVAGTGYVAVRAIDAHHDEIRLPRRFFFVYVIVFVMAFGVVWEVFEYGLDVLAAHTGLSMPLSQHGLDDTVIDMQFNTGGAVVVALWGQAHLVGVSELVRERFLES